MLAATQHGPPQGPMNLMCMTPYYIVQDIMCWINACIDGHMDPGMDLPLDQLVERSKQTWFTFIHVNSIYYTHLQSYTGDTMMSPPSALEQFNHIKGIQGPYQTWRIENMFIFFLLINYLLYLCQKFMMLLKNRLPMLHTAKPLSIA